MKSKTNLIALAIIVLVGLVSASSMSRNVPTNPSGDFQITYLANASGTWGASIVDVVSGGCTFPDGTSTYRSVMLNTDGNSKSITVKKNSATTCTFSGDYKFGTDSTVTFSDKTVTFSNGTGCALTLCSDGTCKASCGGAQPPGQGFCWNFAWEINEELAETTGIIFDCQTATIIFIVGCIALLVLFIVIAK